MVASATVVSATIIASHYLFVKRLRINNYKNAQIICDKNKMEVTMAKGIIELSSGIETSASVVGGNEYAGPLGQCFDMHDESDYFGADTWEKAESEMQRRALALAMKKAGLEVGDIGAM